ncbi:Mitochondrial 2-methylisocitrate lyase [Schizosaccharomyces pombe]|uniref:Mitochondrial 2-methylisocitrate lyase n=1 Tax=Schizosaccharomyces pombe (strain 972 / ATCC 24843) TaxID=284812 RepID=ACEB_SCHPO|nr:putative isocitrate lyase [Schizosaccharomyces pombe]Q9P6J1.1 RecName: Full=Mitochondrial 2-methylisocitrate lyase; Short=Methylisocitrate lyase [Schizosaccharomyces pombe 972h-]CAB91173.1 isocitrate lyase (predicted) [Schizosaccharomyces pombe]|eukprot:NP_595067.1 putative isocitrate lyase [Schizosaccharomyces pombe]
MTTDMDLEQLEYEKEVEEIEKWWATPKQSQIKRPYTASTVAVLSEVTKAYYPSSQQALKLYDLLREHRNKGTATLTYGVVDPVLASQASKAGLETIFVSGCLCGLSSVDEPGMDHADYPWDTVPKAVDRIFRSQNWHARRQKQFHLMKPAEERKQLPKYDYLLPIIADGDMGFGSVTSTMKMTKRFVESGVAMIHLDDLAIGLKRFTVGQGRTVVPTSEYLRRLTAVRLQFDIMKAETMLLCRCDTDHAEFITSVVDPRDHAYVLGATTKIESLIKALKDAESTGVSMKKARENWIERAKLMTFDEAVKSTATPKEYENYISAISKKPFHSISERQELAEKYLSNEVFFDWELPRSSDGQYFFKPTVQTVIERAIAAAPLGEMTWARMDYPKWQDIKAFHEGVRAVYPDRMFAFGFTGNYDFKAAGFSEEQLRNLTSDMAKLGVCWQVQPYFTCQVLNKASVDYSNIWKKDGIFGYVKTVQEPALKEDVDGFENEWCGTYFADKLLSAAGSSDKTIPY